MFYCVYIVIVFEVCEEMCLKLLQSMQKAQF